MPGREAAIQPRGFQSLEAEAWVRVLMAAERLRRGAEAVCERHGLTGDQYKVLRILSGAYPAGQSRCEVMRHCMHRSPDMTRMIDRLVRRRLVMRARSAEDGRFSLARLTRTGLALLEKLDPEIESEIRRAMQPLSQSEQRELARLCQALVQ
jgi:DNA-binding MarR family transcriptional regulator